MWVFCAQNPAQSCTTTCSDTCRPVARHLDPFGRLASSLAAHLTPCSLQAHRGHVLGASTAREWSCMCCMVCVCLLFAVDAHSFMQVQVLLLSHGDHNLDLHHLCAVDIPRIDISPLTPAAVVQLATTHAGVVLAASQVSQLEQWLSTAFPAGELQPSLAQVDAAAWLHCFKTRLCTHLSFPPLCCSLWAL